MDNLWDSIGFCIVGCDEYTYPVVKHLLRRQYPTNYNKESG